MLPQALRSIWGVDYQNVIPSYGNGAYGAGRPSVRISTQKSWTHGLFIGDFAHTPGGICGTWPACGCHAWIALVLIIDIVRVDYWTELAE